MQSVLGNKSEQRETTTKKNALMNTRPRKKKAPKMEERGGSAGQAWCSKKSVSKAKMVNKKENGMRMEGVADADTGGTVLHA